MAKGGVKEAAKLLAGLGLKGRDSVLDLIAKKDPRMAELLKKNLVDFEDLKFLSPKMLQELLRDVDREDLARSLRAASDEVKNFFLKNVSSTIRSDIEKILLGPPMSLDRINESKEKIMKMVLEKIEKGKIILKNDDQEID